MSTQVVPRAAIAIATATVLALSATFLVISASTAPARGAATVSSSTADPGASFARKILKIVNEKRQNRGKRPLKAQKCVSNFAASWGDHLASTNGWEHSDLYKLLNRCDMSAAAENLAKYPDGMTPRQVVKLWMNSDGHRRNILNGTYGKSGVAVVWDADQEVWYAVQDFTRR